LTVVFRSTFASVSIILLAALLACRAIFRGRRNKADDTVKAGYKKAARFNTV
jgi:hypothetical protein